MTYDEQAVDAVLALQALIDHPDRPAEHEDELRSIRAWLEITLLAEPWLDSVRREGGRDVTPR